MRTHILLEDCNTNRKLLVPINLLILKSPKHQIGQRTEYYAQVLGNGGDNIQISVTVFDELVNLLGLSKSEYK